MTNQNNNSFELSDEHLSLLCARLNSEQLAAVRETRNVVVSAGAGSGKTTVLASRYTYLVEARNVSCEKILTLTFTKKAANEMKERIFNGLRNHLRGFPIKRDEKTPPLPADFPHLDEIKSRARAAIESFDKAHIQTLDSYFSEVARRGAHFYGISPDFTLDDDKISSVIRHKATKYVLEHLEDEEIKEIASVFRIQNVAEDLFAASVLRFSTVLTPVDFASSLERQKKAVIDEYERVTARISDEISAFIALPRSPKAGGTLLKLYDYIDEVACPESPPLTEAVFESAGGASEFLSERFLAYCGGISGYCGRDFSYIRDESYKIFKAALLPLLETLYLLANSISGFALTKKIFAHLAEFQRDVSRTKRTGGFLSFADVSELALACLRDHDEIRHIEQQKFDAIMIDEFQDDNQLQCDVLLILADKDERRGADGAYQIPRLSDTNLLERLDAHKLFFVGDDKQSIYRFRGADVCVFRNLSSSIKNSLALKTNYRSDAELISGFNTIFGGYDYPCGEQVSGSLPAVFMTEQKFPPRTDGSPRIPGFEADYKKAAVPEARLEAADFSVKKITIALYPKGDEADGSQTPADGESPDADRRTYECEASFVAREIKSLLAQKDADGNQKYHYKDIALLFRTATPTAAYENVLLACGIPYSTEVYKGFFSDGPINDILSLLKLCVYPEDKNAYAKVLRSPFCSLTFAELERILVNTESPYKKPFDAQMIEAISDDPTLTEKILGLRAVYDNIRARLKAEKLTKTISYIWYELGYRYETMWNKSVAMYASFYDILFELARLAEDKTQSLASFIDMVRSYEGSDKKLDGLDVVMDATDAVQILTVHKSKGLEFKVVFVCAVSARSVIFPDGIGLHKEFGFLLATPPWRDYQKSAESLAGTSAVRKNEARSYFFSLVSSENEAQESAELRRLAYVAFTRAEEKLYIVGNSDGEFEDEEKSRQFEPHCADETGFTYLKTHKKEKGELVPLKTPKETSVDYAAPRTIYQLLLPVLFAGACADGVRSPAFNFVSDKASFAAVSAERARISTKADFISHLADSGDIQPVVEELSPIVYVSPSFLESGEEGRAAAGGNDAEPHGAPEYANPDYTLINKIVASTVPCGSGEVPVLEDSGEETESGGWRHGGGGHSEAAEAASPAFTFANFGTIAHAYMEARVLGCEPAVPAREWIGLNERFIPDVRMESWEGGTNREKKIARVRALCGDMAEKFAESSIYKEAAASDWKKTEYSFRSLLDKSFVTGGNAADSADDYADELIAVGQIDLVYKNQAESLFRYTIVDYKTNQTVEPSLYYKQLACYRKAVSAMLGCDEREIRCVLYYLRFARAVDVTGQI